MPALPAARRAALRAATGADIDAARLLVERGQDVLAMAAVAAGADGTKAVTRLVNDLAVDDWSKVDAESFADPCPDGVER